MDGFMIRPWDGLPGAGGVALECPGTRGVSWSWVLGPVGEGPLEGSLRLQARVSLQRPELQEACRTGKALVP